ncbi:MAG: hypothetical protein WC179_05850 [Candidatus Cloacimonadaceae bacterium]|jgi:hypothetical protein|nr:hypothetical protein [Candidatus Cloacimonadota bacterium]MDD5625293.1 hypothetical protein [Candidatus Cloacimonadota bacterium]MDY0111942.1 hypothetical protein [Candidatus Syntrophosphaera sp.]
MKHKIILLLMVITLAVTTFSLSALVINRSEADSLLTLSPKFTPTFGTQQWIF